MTAVLALGYLASLSIVVGATLVAALAAVDHNLRRRTHP
jgi:hypothetical protein